ncbi:MAG TPA: hypothetical protein VF649_10185 [Sphingomonas sp.]|jgi:hypothetical protein|uniref:hypothetical protein n=1 Tax=Sphingomonas sp. TaxID=28214 RepID=UPI002EDB58B5
MTRFDAATAIAADEDALLLGALADELLAARLLAEELGVSLCIDPVVVERHRIQLQDLDLVAQLLEQCARLLRVPTGRAAAVDDVTLAAMRARLGAALGHAPAPAPEMDDEIW